MLADNHVDIHASIRDDILANIRNGIHGSILGDSTSSHPTSERNIRIYNFILQKVGKKYSFI